MKINQFGTSGLGLRIEVRKTRASALDPPIGSSVAMEEYSFGDVYINFKAQEATKNKNPIELSTMEFKLLKYLCQRENTVIQRSTLLDEVWGYENYPSTRTVDNFILTLRKKIEDEPTHPVHLLTVHGAGYKFVK